MCWILCNILFMLHTVSKAFISLLTVVHCSHSVSIKLHMEFTTHMMNFLELFGYTFIWYIKCLLYFLEKNNTAKCVTQTMFIVQTMYIYIA